MLKPKGKRTVTMMILVIFSDHSCLFHTIYFSPKIKKLLSNGTSIVTDRYAFSGVAFTAAKVRFVGKSNSIDK